MKKKSKKTAQTALEYMLLLSAVVVIVITGFSRYIDSSRTASEGYFNNVSVGILGTPPNGIQLQHNAL